MRQMQRWILVDAGHPVHLSFLCMYLMGWRCAERVDDMDAVNDEIQASRRALTSVLRMLGACVRIRHSRLPCPALRDRISKPRLFDVKERLVENIVLGFKPTERWRQRLHASHALATRAAPAQGLIQRVCRSTF